eukprot:COSAG01_NODE_1793_length_9215_cov_16.655002_1_plen_50_part_00
MAYAEKKTTKVGMNGTKQTELLRIPTEFLKYIKPIQSCRHAHRSSKKGA